MSSDLRGLGLVVDGLGLHELAHEPGEALAQNVGVFIAMSLRSSSSRLRLDSAIVVLLSSFPCNGSPVRSGLLEENDLDALASSGFDPVGVCLTGGDDAGVARPQADRSVSLPEPQGGLPGVHVE
jgi:hypothetical protein